MRYGTTTLLRVSSGNVACPSTVSPLRHNQTSIGRSEARFTQHFSTMETGLRRLSERKMMPVISLIAQLYCTLTASLRLRVVIGYSDRWRAGGRLVSPDRSHICTLYCQMIIDCVFYFVHSTPTLQWQWGAVRPVE